MSVNNFDLTTCGVPVDNPVTVVLTVKSSSLTLAQAQLSENALSCQVTATVGGYADCAATVTDGVLDSYQTANNPENYRLEVWEVITNTNVFTTELPSGDMFFTQRSYTYGEKDITGLLFYLVIVVTLAVIVFSIVLFRLR